MGRKLFLPYPCHCKGVVEGRQVIGPALLMFIHWLAHLQLLHCWEWHSPKYGSWLGLGVRSSTFIHQRQLCTALRYQHLPKRHLGSRASTWPLVTEPPSCCKAMDLDAPHPSVAAQSRIQVILDSYQLVIHIRMFLTTPESPILSLFIVPPPFCFSFSSIFPPLTCSS